MPILNVHTVILTFGKMRLSLSPLTGKQYILLKNPDQYLEEEEETQTQIKMTVFGDVNVSVYGNSDVLKFTFTFKCVLLENQKCNYFNHLLYIAALYLLFIPVSFIKFNP